MEEFKIGDAERELMNLANELKERYGKRIESVKFGLEIARRQIPNSDSEEVRKVLNNIDKELNAIRKLKSTIDSLEFSEELDEEKFWVTWYEYESKGENYWQRGYGNRFTMEPITEKQFIYAILSWEREICKMLAFFDAMQGDEQQNLCSDTESFVHKMMYQYMHS